MKAFLSLLLALTLLVLSTGCGTIVQNVFPNDDSYHQNGSYGTGNDAYDTPTYDNGPAEEYNFTNVTTLASQDHIKYTIEDDLQEAFPGYSVDYVECVYISQEYIDEVMYNSLSNVYFGYDLDEIAAYMQDKNWAFTVDENGQTVVAEVQKSSNALADMVKKVAIGTGVIVICVVISSVSGGLGAAPVACFFAGAAKGALVGAVSGAAVSGIIGGAITGVQTKSWDAAFDAAMMSAADGYMWGAISGALVGGFSSTTCFAGDTLVKTDEGYKPIMEIEVGDQVYSWNEQTDLYEFRPVSHVTKQIANDIVKVTVGGEEIVTTATHPFYTTEGWVDAQELSNESLVLTKDGYVRVEAVDDPDSDEELWVYNLTVAYTHTYTVSEFDVVVHNACGDSAKLRKNLVDAGDTVPDYPNAAHHIVPASDNRYKASIRAQEKLRSLGIEKNEACNGVFLSTSKHVTGTTYHRTLHTEAYYEKILRLLNTASTREEGIEVLGFIKQSLLNGTFMP